MTSGDAGAPMRERLRGALARYHGEIMDDVYDGAIDAVLRELGDPTAAMVLANRSQEAREPTNPVTRDDPDKRARWEAACLRRIHARFACMIAAAKEGK